ncbi:hypothetical protein B0H14DRAFT_2572396 [Mycena olivaceomarginata]|nr:hypothetical protein B0H14DRAFT_2572396 [Mycena olivaceomarginata]
MSFQFLLRLYSLRVGCESLLLTTLDLVAIYEQRKLNGGFSVRALNNCIFLPHLPLIICPAPRAFVVGYEPHIWTAKLDGIWQCRWMFRFPSDNSDSAEPDPCSESLNEKDDSNLIESDTVWFDDDTSLARIGHFRPTKKLIVAGILYQQGPAVIFISGLNENQRRDEGGDDTTPHVLAIVMHLLRLPFLDSTDVISSLGRSITYLDSKVKRKGYNSLASLRCPLLLRRSNERGPPLAETERRTLDALCRPGAEGGTSIATDDSIPLDGEWRSPRASQVQKDERAADLRDELACIGDNSEEKKRGLCKLCPDGRPEVDLRGARYKLSEGRGGWRQGSGGRGSTGDEGHVSAGISDATSVGVERGMSVARVRTSRTWNQSVHLYRKARGDG